MLEAQLWLDQKVCMAKKETVENLRTDKERGKDRQTDRRRLAYRQKDTNTVELH